MILEAKELTEILWKETENMPKPDEFSESDEAAQEMLMKNRKVYMELMSW